MKCGLKSDVNLCCYNNYTPGFQTIYKAFPFDISLHEYWFIYIFLDTHGYTWGFYHLYIGSKVYIRVKPLLDYTLIIFTYSLGYQLLTTREAFSTLSYLSNLIISSFISQSTLITYTGISYTILTFKKTTERALETVSITSDSSVQNENHYLEPTPKVDILDVLPVELVLLVAFFLPREDICSLSLCSHRHLEIFRSQTKHKLKIEVLLPFLCRLERDNPRYLACDDCLVLHHFDSIPEPLRLPSPIVYRQSTYYPPLLGCTQTSRFWPVAHNYLRMPIHDGRSTHCGYRLHWSHLHLAIRRFFHDPQYGISTDALAFTGV